MSPTEGSEFALDIMGAPMRSISHFTHTAPADDDFVEDPYLLTDQADGFEQIVFGDESLPNAQENFYALYRGVRIQAPGGFECDGEGWRWGVHMVVYRCDADGRVDSWQERVELHGVSTKSVRAKFQFLHANNLLQWTFIRVPLWFENGQG